MILRTCRLEQVTEAQRPAAAWCIAGQGPEEWLGEIGRWGLEDDSSLRIYVMPQPAPGRGASALFVVVPDGQAPRQQPAALAFGRVGKKCYVPVDSLLLPAMSEAEVDALSPTDSLWVLHPGMGSVCFEKSDERRVADLIIPPPERPERWSAPPPGLPDLPSLSSIAVKAPALDELFGQSAQDIGSEPPPELRGGKSKNSGPPLKGLLKGLGAAGAMALVPFLRFAGKWFQNREDRSGKKGRIGKNIQDWLGRQINRLNDNLLDARQRALKKLLDDLEKNPEEGLRHALPLASSGLHRGAAPPSGQLGSRKMDFNLSRIGGGRPVDGWDVPQDFQRELRRHYLVQANREIQLGRHRRAACIYAELLGDLTTAAIVLKNGGFYAEAAILYRDHLHRPLEAAACFVSGGQIAEAVKLYEAGACWDKLGALYRQLGDEAKASRTFEIWVRDLLASDDRLQAAHILLDELKQRDNALAVLEGAWDRSRQAVPCVEQALAWRGEAGEHAEASRLVGSLLSMATGERRKDAIALFGRLQRSYPDRGVRSVAEDAARREIAIILPGASINQHAELVRLLAQLSPDDSLLRRDALRYFDTQRCLISSKPERTARQQPLGTADIIAIEEETHFALSWKHPTSFLCAARSSGNRFCALAYSNSSFEIMAVQGEMRRSRDWVSASWAIPQSMWTAGTKPLLAIAPGMARQTLVCYPGEAGVGLRPVTDAGADGAKHEIGTPPWLTDPVWAAGYEGNGDLLVLRMTRIGLRLSQFSQQGAIKSDQLVPSLEEALGEAGNNVERPLPMVVTARHMIFGIGNCLTTVPLSGGAAPGFARTRFDTPIRALAQAPLWSSPRVAVITERTISIHWLGSNTHSRVVCEDLEETPHAVFTNDGALLVVSGRQGFVIHANSAGEVQRWRFELPSKAAGLLALADLWRFAVIDDESRLTICRYENRLRSGG